ncbi:hypothetical protein BGZ61DRAFT_528933 [Ilyonectria robusta]|uniref:uncharacterized protein n=1 Tax=Ilyonectria robusta TaxID=1079257 RepID=UPI001E8E04E4|nr:uncharacterized protein BGZ61DRAFT_528933 [Ilyonectria robusta]KAH8733670.1 hypothetical protein BGZ61DRAFT_528933 [Ilyonectria robusta]
MEALGAAASVIAVLQLSTSVIEYINAASGAKKERRELRGEIRACTQILQELRDEAGDSEEGQRWQSTINALEEPGAPLGRLWAVLTIMAVKLQPKRGLKKIAETLKWPFEEKELGKLMDIIHRELGLLQVALANNSRKLIADIHRSKVENTAQLAELIALVQTNSKDNHDGIQELKDQLTLFHGSQNDLRDGINRLELQNDDRETAEERALALNWLSLVDFTSQQTDSTRRHQRGTGQWLLDSQEYKSWYEAENQTLFCPGIPGAGKTILTSVVINDLADRSRDDTSVGLAYLYCNFRREGEQKMENFLASLVRQLSQKHARLPDTVKSIYQRHKGEGTRPSVVELSKALKLVTDMYSRVFVVVDALDECQKVDGSRGKLLSELFDLQASHGVNIFATSRFIPEIVDEFSEGASLEIRASPEDVLAYLDGNMSRLPRFVLQNQTLQDEIKTKIVEAVDGMFLLAQLHLDSLIGKTVPKAVRTTLQKLSTGSNAYDHAYDRIVERIEGQIKDQEDLAKQAVSWIVCSETELTTLQLQHALAVEIGEPQFDKENMPHVDDIVSVCAGLVTVDEHTKIIRLVHFTTQEYFRRSKATWIQNAAHVNIARVCLTYLCFDIFRDGVCVHYKDFQERLDKYPLFKYASHYLGIHAVVASLPPLELMEFLECDSAVEASFQALLVGKLSWSHPSYTLQLGKKSRGLHYASVFGLDEAVTMLLDRQHHVDVEDGHGRTPLSFAAENGHIAIIKLLLGRGAKVDSMASGVENGRTPLSFAAEGAQEDSVKLLLEQGANPNSQEYVVPRGWERAKSEDGKVYYVNHFSGTTTWSDPRYDTNLPEGWERRIAPNERPYYVDHNTRMTSWDAPQQTVSNLEKSKLDGGRTPLLYAVIGDKLSVVKVLLAVDDIDINKVDNIGRTPLHHAVMCGHRPIFELLFARDEIVVDVRDIVGSTAFSAAASRDELWYMEQLLAAERVDPDQKDNFGSTPLQHAAGRGHIAMVERLLATHRVDPGGRDCIGRTPLSCAAEKGHGAIVELLLATKRVDPTLKDVTGQTPFDYAVAAGDESSVRALTSYGESLGPGV